MQLTEISFTIIGEEREGGYQYLTSPDLKGFRLLVRPGENELEIMKDVLTEHLMAYFRAGHAFPPGAKLKEIRPSPTPNFARKGEIGANWWHTLMKTRGLPMVAEFAA